MSAYTDVVDAARNRNGRLFKQVQRSVLYFAQYISDTIPEVPEGPTAAADLRKRTWAMSILLGRIARSEEVAERLIPLVLGNGDIAAGEVAPTEPPGEAPGSPDSLVQQIVETKLPILWAS